MITEDYVSFETAKLLKEKGFDEECSCFYNNIDYGTPGLEVDGQLYYKNSALDDEEYAAPTLQMAMKWLREKKLYINIWADPKDAEHNNFEIVYSTTVFNGNSNFGTHEFSSYEEAAEAGIKYCLEKLI